MAAFQFGFSSPTNYSDWATYAGLDRKTGQFAPTMRKAGVPPPENFSEYVQQAVAPAQQAFAKFTNAATQLGQGNFSNPFQMPSMPSVQTPDAAAQNLYDFASQIGQ